MATWRGLITEEMTEHGDSFDNMLRAEVGGSHRTTMPLRLLMTGLMSSLTTASADQKVTPSCYGPISACTFRLRTTVPSMCGACRAIRPAT